jgi:serine/threonine protein kinase
VFEGYDQRTGLPVVVKQARAYVDLDPSGADSRDRLRHEADVLGRLAPHGLVSGVLDVVDAGEHLFLVREAVAGTTLRRWVSGQAEAGGVPVDAGLAMAGALVRLVDAVHRAGLVLVDVSPNNVIVDPGGALWLIDVDHAADAGEVVYPVGTPGYTPPEHRSGVERSVVARPEADVFGLGGLLFLIAVGTDPTLAEDEPAGRPVQDRVRAWLDVAGPDLPLVGRLAAAVLGMMREQPGRRWRPERVLRYLGRVSQPFGGARDVQKPPGGVVHHPTKALRARARSTLPRGPRMVADTTPVSTPPPPCRTPPGRRGHPPRSTGHLLAWHSSGHCTLMPVNSTVDIP